jgi:DNA-damage-inducible protein J
MFDKRSFLKHTHYVFLGYNVTHIYLRENAMVTNAVVRARIDEHIKEEAAAVLSTIGLTVSDAFRLLLIRVAREKALPFEPLIPNAVTIEAMKEAQTGKLPRAHSVEELMDALHADD